MAVPFRLAVPRLKRKPVACTYVTPQGLRRSNRVSTGVEKTRSNWSDAWWARASFGIVVMALWLLLVFIVGNLGGFPRAPASEPRSGIPWLVVGTLGFTLFSIATIARSRSGNALVPAWSQAVPWLISLALTCLFVALHDAGARASFPDGPPSDKFFGPRPEDWPSYLAFPITLVIGGLVVVDRLVPEARTALTWTIVAVGVLPFPTLGALLLTEL